MLSIVKAIPVLLAAVLLGNWFLAEVRKAKAARKPWYAPYLTIPGVLVVIVILIPILIHFYR